MNIDRDFASRRLMSAHTPSSRTKPPLGPQADPQPIRPESNGPQRQALATLRAVDVSFSPAVAAAESTAIYTEEIAEKKDKDLELLKLTFGIKDNEKSETEKGDEDETTEGKGESDETAGSVSIEMSASVHTETEVSAEVSVEQSDPLALDLDGDGVQTTGVDEGIMFDIDGDGDAEKTSFVKGGDAFLAYDKNGNGVIDSGKELFGDQNGAANGFGELARHDSNSDGWIDKDDPVFSKLSLFDGRGQVSLGDAGVRAISVDYSQTYGATSAGDRVAQSGSFVRTDGSTGGAYDLLLNNRAVV